MTQFVKITTGDIAAAMDLKEWEVWRLAENLEHYFLPSRKQRIGNKYRLIDPVGRSLKRRFRKLHRWLQRQKLAHPRAFGGVVHRSCFLHAQLHLGRKFVWTRDVCDCFPSIGPEAMRTALLLLGFQSETAKLLALLFTVRGRVPQGSPLSNDALNLFFWAIDQSLSSVAGQSRLSFGRSCDDFVISGNQLLSGDSAVRLLEQKLKRLGLRVNQKKRKEIGLQRRDSGQRIHNIDITSRRGTRITREQRHDVVVLCQKYVTACRSLQPSSIPATAYLRTRLVGYMHYHRQAKFSLARHIRQQIRIGDRHVLRKLDSLNITAERNKWWLKQRGSDEPLRIMRLWARGAEAGQ